MTNRERNKGAHNRELLLSKKKKTRSDRFSTAHGSQTLVSRNQKDSEFTVLSVFRTGDKALMVQTQEKSVPALQAEPASCLLQAERSQLSNGQSK